jgi:DNA sulfur modification protein DndD
MAGITIKSLSIQNLGPFRQRQVIDFSVKTGKPVILIKALNGSGKTTLLTALQVGLYGQKALTDLKRSEYEQLIRGLKRRDVLGNSIVEIAVEVEIGSDRRHLLVRREWSVNGETLTEQISVSENGSNDELLSLGWDVFIGTALPAELVQLFLFDGEKIEALANPDRLPELLKRATEVFLGIGGIDALSYDLRALERRAVIKNKGDSEAFNEARTNLLNWQAQLEELERKVETLTQERASAQNLADQTAIALDRFSAEAQQKGLLAYEQAAEIRSAVTHARKAVEAARADLIDTMSDPTLPIAWVASMWPQYQRSWEDSQNIKHAKLLGQEFKKRDQRILTALEKSLPKGSAVVLRQALDSDLRSYITARRSSAPHMLDAAPRDVERQLEVVRSRAKRELEHIKNAQAMVDRAEQRIGQIPAEEQISGILVQLQERSKTASLAAECLAQIVQKLGDTQNSVAHVNMRLKAAQDRINSEFRNQSMEAKSLEAAVRARKVLIIFKDRLLASKALWLSDMITTEFQKLLHKQNLMTSVVIDPQTYRVSILDSKKQERQLLATSVLSALIKERKGRFPVVVDTPLARLDQLHRSALIKGFFATVSHQVVVLSTDQEVKGSVHSALSPFTSQEYELSYDDVTGCSTTRRLRDERTH